MCYRWRMPVPHNARHVLSSFSVQNLGPVKLFSAERLGMINVFLGENSAGKTYMMKMLYAACKVMETYRKGQNVETLLSLLTNKLYWTYQTPKLSSIVTRRSSGGMKFSCRTCDGEDFVVSLTNGKNLHVPERKEPYKRAGMRSNSIFLPAKEVLTSFDVIVSSRDDDQKFGFDDTYYDLARILQRPPSMGRNFPHVAEARSLINDIFDAKAVYDEKGKRWMITKGRDKLDVNEASEGVKKLSILDILLGNRYIGRGSVIFIDEPESALHPGAISKFMDAVYQMSKDGIQFMMATHSYFVIKKLANIAKRFNIDIPVFSYQADGEGTQPQWVTGNMKNGLPDNPIVRESVKLYQEDLNRWV